MKLFFETIVGTGIKFCVEWGISGPIMQDSFLDIAEKHPHLAFMELIPKFLKKYLT